MRRERRASSPAPTRAPGRALGPAFHPNRCQTRNARRWKPDASGGLSRVFTFVQPKKGVISAPASCVQKHRLSAHPGGVLSLTTDMRASGIPYGDCFRVQSFWTVRCARVRIAGARVCVYSCRRVFLQIVRRQRDGMH